LLSKGKILSRLIVVLIIEENGTPGGVGLRGNP
jgi:hypothetical protein